MYEDHRTVSEARRSNDYQPSRDVISGITIGPMFTYLGKGSKYGPTLPRSVLRVIENLFGVM